LKYNKKEMKNLFVNKDYDRFGTVDRRKKRNDMAVNKEYLGTNITRTRYKDDGFRSPKSVLKINKQSQTNVHPTQKPVALLKYLIKTYTKENETVLDFTMGSGSTGVACKHLNRNFIGVELDAKYFNIAKKRIDEKQKSK
jgi:DNA modification methylase